MEISLLFRRERFALARLLHESRCLSDIDGLVGGLDST
jgi:hypothetical protein